eukprot:827095-Pyramimonas_sp.AAC.1
MKRQHCSSPVVAVVLLSFRSNGRILAFAVAVELPYCSSSGPLLGGAVGARLCYGGIVLYCCSSGVVNSQLQYSIRESSAVQLSARGALQYCSRNVVAVALG